MTIKHSSKPICISYIRFSTPEQLKGDSLRRQLRIAKEYADKHGLLLDESLSLKDLGLSAYHGEHKKKGAMRRLLELIDSGKIPKGSVLIIESFDRLSREKVFEALTQFQQIVSKGIKIVTAIDGKEYDKDLGVQDIMYSLGVMARAHEESATKAKRLKEAWKDKRNDISTKKLTALCPAWLRLNAKTQLFEPITERRDLVKRIYSLYLHGNGAEKIARTLNVEGITAWRSKNGWHKSYIQKILHNRAVIGEFQPYCMEHRKRIAEGSPIQGYFPQIISREDFYRVQERLKANTGKGGRTGKISNLFGHIAKCGYCGSPMQYINKGNGDQYLVCDNARRGRGCSRILFRYKEFEDTFIKCCTELDYKGILPNASDVIQEEISRLNAVIEGLEGELAANAVHKKNLNFQLRQNLSALFIKEVSQNLKHALDEEQQLKESLEKAESELAKLTNVEKKAEAQLKGITDLLSTLKEKTGAELVMIRQKLRMEIRKLVKRIEVFPEGLKGKILSLGSDPATYIDYRNPMAAHIFDKFDPDIHKTRRAFLERRNAFKRELDKYVEDTTGKQLRQFSLWFHTGGFKEVIHRDGVYKIAVSGKDYFSALSNAMDAVKDMQEKIKR